MPGVGQRLMLMTAAMVCLEVMTWPDAALADGGPKLIADAAFYRSEVTAIVPPVVGITARVDPAGEWVEITNTSPTAVIILGYLHEPYLRVTATEVDENQLSASKYLNTAMFAALPTGAAGELAPQWMKIATTGSARWHDHRIHWMGQVRPPAVATDPRRPHLVGTWTVLATAGKTPFEVHGAVRWIGKPDSASGIKAVPDWVLYLVETLALAVIVLVAILLRQRQQSRRVATTPEVHSYLDQHEGYPP
jgi:hypothetical protein